MAVSFGALSPAALCRNLKERLPTIAKTILDSIIEHKIDGEVFLSLTDDNLREIAPLLGDRLKIKRVISTLVAEHSTKTVSLEVNRIVINGWLIV